MPTTINVDNVPARHLIFKANGPGPEHNRYIVSAEELDTIEAINRWPNWGVLTCSFHEEDAQGRWFAFANCDCAFPPHAVVRARTFEDAYEAFCDEFKDWMKIGESDLADYKIDSDEPTCSFAGDGTPIDTEAVHGFELELMSIECF